MPEELTVVKEEHFFAPGEALSELLVISFYLMYYVLIRAKTCRQTLTVHVN